MESEPVKWYKALPPLTKAFGTLFVVTTALVKLEYVRPATILLYWPVVTQRLQVWRLFTNLLYLGPFSVSFFIDLSLFMSFSGKLERSKAFAHSTKRYFLFIVMNVLLLEVLSHLLFAARSMQTAFLGQCLVFAVVALWSQTEPDADVAIVSFAIKARHFPLAILLLQVLAGISFVSSLFGFISAMILGAVQHMVARSDGGAGDGGGGQTNASVRYVLV